MDCQGRSSPRAGILIILTALALVGSACGRVDGIGAGLVQVRTDCAAGFSAVGTYGTEDSFCISTAARPAGAMLAAIQDCYQHAPAAHLCTSAEWTEACASAIPSGMGTAWEWVTEFSDALGIKLGNGGCTSASGATSPLASLPYRCCYR